MPMERGMGKYIVVCPHDRILYTSENEVLQSAQRKDKSHM
jgi:hypothetical protein